MDGVSAAASIIALVDISIKNPGAAKLVTLKSIAESTQQCGVDLENLQKKLEPSKGRKAMSRYGVRALKWPFERKELHNHIGTLERYKSTFSAALNADQTALILESGVKLDLAEQARCLSSLSYAAGANFDSIERENEPFCLPETRVEILSQIMEWSADLCHRSIFWLNGMAGTGKSTIARTIARSLTEQNRLAGSFFFSKGRGDLSHAGKLLSTIAIQLAGTSPTLKRYICKAIAENENIGRQSMHDQWTKLICQPISRLKGDLQPPLILVFVFDALDECGRQEDIQKLLRLLAETKDLAAVQLRVLVTSRPEIPIRLGFRAIPGNTHKDFVLHDIALPVIQHDIATFLKHEINNIRDERLLPSDWPGDKKLESLAEKSRGLFIYAATVCRFIRDPRWLPVKRLDIVLQDNSAEQRPEQRLDKKYTQILESSVFGDCDEQERDLLSRHFRDIVGAIIVLFDSFSLSALKSLFSTFSETMNITLDPLKSLLNVPDDGNTPIRLLHPSFRDFLVNQERCQASHFWIDQKKTHHDVGERCLHLMTETLKRNICQLETPGTSKYAINNLVLNEHLPFELQYACQYWVGHVQKGTLSVYDVTQVYLFLQTHFLHWLEALSFMEKMSEAVHLITLLATIPEFQTNPDLLAFVKDAKRFILEFRYVVETTPLQLYNSALVFSPKASLVRKYFIDQMPGWIESLPKVEENWTSSLQVLEGHSSCVRTVVFSPDDRLLASGSFDNTVRLWDPVTGASQGTLRGHYDIVKAVVFSPDSQLLASGSCDNTVRLWDLATGVLRSTLEGHLDSVNAVVFSSDGRILASGSDDKTIRLWDPITGESRTVLTGHLDRVTVVAFSPDDQLLASGSYDNTVRLWDPITGYMRGLLTGHLDSVIAVVFSSDGQLLASGSHDKTIRLWDPLTGNLQSMLEGHSSIINAVVFSPDGRLLASGSDDMTIRLWDPVSGTLQDTLTGHKDPIKTVVFSADSQMLASGSRDTTVRLWDPVTGNLLGILEGHSSWITTVVFSSDGQLLASGSIDKTVRLFNSGPLTGDLRCTVEGHSDCIHSIVFSPDNQLLASGSRDPAIRLWDSVTGDLQSTLEGHLDSVFVVVFSPDGQLLASGSHDNTVKLWDPFTGDLRHTFEGHLNLVITVVFSPNGQLLASGSADKTVRLWDPLIGESRRTLEGHFGGIFAIVFSPDGQLLASGSYDMTVNLWDSATGDLRATLRAIFGNNSDRLCVIVFSPDDCQLMASGSHDKTVKLRDSVTRDSQVMLEDPLKWVEAAVFFPNCVRKVFTSRDHTVGLCLIENSPLLQGLENALDGNIYFVGDGSQLLLNDRPVEIQPVLMSVSLQARVSDDFYSLRGNWVRCKGCDVLWLPSNHRAQAYAIQDNTLVIGNHKGGMNFLRFSKTCLPF